MVNTNSVSVQLYAIDLFRAVFDPSSLEVFWAELTAGAYGTVDRAVGLFNLVDGRAYQILYAGNGAEIDYVEIEDSPCLKGRPDRPCRLEISGYDLDIEAIESTLKVCTLADQALDYYQSQLQAQLQ